MFSRTLSTMVCAFACVILVDSLGVQANERREMIDRLVEQLQSSDWQDRMSAAVGLGDAGANARHALPALFKAKSDKHEKVRQWADKSIEKIYKTLKTDVPLEVLIEQVAEPTPPKWNRIPAYGAIGKGLEDGGLRFGDSRIAVGTQNEIFLPGYLGIRIPLPYRKHSHSRFVGKSVTLDDGALLVKLTQGYVPQLWEEREIVAAKTLKGKFAVLDLPKLPEGRKWWVIYDDLENGHDLDRDGRGDVTLRVVPTDFECEDFHKGHGITLIRIIDGVRGE